MCSGRPGPTTTWLTRSSASSQPSASPASEVPRDEAIAASRGTSLAGLALGWLLTDERVSQVVIGPGRPEHLTPVAEALEHPLTGEERAAVESAVS